MIHVFTLDFTTVTSEKIADLSTLLSCAEQKRLLQMTSRKRQTEFVIGHTLARFAVSRVLGIPVEKIVISTLSSGALSVVGKSDCFISLSHTRQRLVIAVSDIPVGIDMEYQRIRPNYDALLTRIGYTVSHASKEAFYRLWTRFEACYKLQSFISEQVPVYYENMVTDNYALCLATPSPSTITYQTIRLADIVFH